jgi:hypothetical protein
MTAIEQAIKEAVEKGGYVDKFYLDGDRWVPKSDAEILLDPLFWQARWIARGGKLTDECATDIRQEGGWMIPEWQYDWLQFILHLAEGKDAEFWFAKMDV